MYVPRKRRRYFITVRDVKPDNSLGESTSFSVYDSGVIMNKKKLIRCLIQKINETEKNDEKTKISSKR